MDASSGDSKTSTPPALPGGKSRRNMLLPLGMLVALLFVLGVIAAFVPMMFRTPGSTHNDEIVSTKKSATDFTAWMTALRRIESAGDLPSWPKAGKSADSDETKVSRWDKWFVLPNENAVRAALLRRLPEGVKLVSFVPQTYEKSDDEISVNYLVTVRLKSALYLVPVSALNFSQPDLMKYQSLTHYVLASDDLPPGMTYDNASAKEVAEAGRNLTFSWRVDRAVVKDGSWRVLEADPLFLEQNPAFEQRLFAATAGGHPEVLRTQSQLDAMAPVRDAALNAFATRLKSIDEQVARYRADKMAGVPGPVSRSTAKFGGSGSGEPTRSAARIGGGAASGAAIGAMATGGDGESAGIGAGAGFVAGLIYDAVSKSNDKKKFEAAKERDYQEQVSARNTALKAAQADVDAFQRQLIDAYEKELSAGAQERMDELKAKS